MNNNNNHNNNTYTNNRQQQVKQQQQAINLHAMFALDITRATNCKPQSTIHPTTQKLDSPCCNDAYCLLEVRFPAIACQRWHDCLEFLLQLFHRSLKQSWDALEVHPAPQWNAVPAKARQLNISWFGWVFYALLHIATKFTIGSYASHKHPPTDVVSWMIWKLNLYLILNLNPIYSELRTSQST